MTEIRPAERKLRELENEARVLEGEKLLRVDADIGQAMLGGGGGNLAALRRAEYDAATESLAATVSSIHEAFRSAWADSLGPAGSVRARRRAQRKRRRVRQLGRSRPMRSGGRAGRCGGLLPSVSGGLAMCEALTSGNEPCGMPPMRGSAFCYVHDPSRSRDRAISRRRAGEATGGARWLRRQARREAAEPVSLRDADQVLALLESEAGHVLTLPASVARARAVGTLCAVAMKLVEAGAYKARLAEIERRLTEARR